MPRNHFSHLFLFSAMFLLWGSLEAMAAGKRLAQSQGDRAIFQRVPIGYGTQSALFPVKVVSSSHEKTVLKLIPRGTRWHRARDRGALSAWIGDGFAGVAVDKKAGTVAVSFDVVNPFIPFGQDYRLEKGRAYSLSIIVKRDARRPLLVEVFHPEYKQGGGKGQRKPYRWANAKELVGNKPYPRPQGTGGI